MKKVSRRAFLTTGAVVFFGCAAGRAQDVRRPGTRKVSPNEKLNVAAVGAGGKGESDIRYVGRLENIVALCDVDWARAAGTFEKFPNATKYKDFRVMLDKQGNEIDALTVSTPDHMHARVAMHAMRMGKHVFVQKPLTHDIAEARMLTEAAREFKVATHMGNQGHQGEGVRRVCEWIWAGRIGPVHEVHIWTNRPGNLWPQPVTRPTDTPPVPETLDWDLWVGTAPMRPYSPAYVPHNWRGFWDFGCGALGDMGCHVMDAAYTGLKLGYPTAVEAKSEGANEEGGPAWSIIKYEFPARDDMPAVNAFWYDGGKLPERPAAVPADEKLGDDASGTLFIGEKGMITCGEYSNEPRLVPYEKPDVPRTIPKSVGHYETWIQACKGGEPAGGNFDYAGPFTEMVLLGNLAIRSGQRIEWDAANMNCTNVPEANKYVRREYREGWKL